MEKVYYVSVDFYDYFAGGSKTETKHFNRIIDAFNYQKESAKHDFYYNDAHQITREIGSYWNTNPKKTHYHLYKEPKRKEPKRKELEVVTDNADLFFSFEEIEHLIGICDEDIVI